MDKKRPHQDQSKSSSEPTHGSDDALHQLVSLLASQAARDWHSTTMSSPNDKEPPHEQSTPYTTPDH